MRSHASCLLAWSVCLGLLRAEQPPKDAAPQVRMPVPPAAAASAQPTAVPTVPFVTKAASSTSTTKQFTVYGGDLDMRGAFCMLCEDTATALGRVLKDNAQFGRQVIVVLKTPPDIDLTKPAVTYNIAELTHGGFHLQINAELRTGFRTTDFTRELVRVLLAERILRNHQKLSTTRKSDVLPAWVMMGVTQALEYRSRSRPSTLFSAVFKRGQVYSLDRIIDADPAMLDALSRGIYETSTCALVLTLLDQPDGAVRFSKFLNGLAVESKSDRALLTEHFPNLATSKSALEKWWSLQMASLATPTAMETLGAAQTEEELDKALTLMIPGARKREEPPKAAEAAPPEEKKTPGTAAEEKKPRGFFGWMKRDSKEEPAPGGEAEQKKDKKAADEETKPAPKQGEATVIGPQSAAGIDGEADKPEIVLLIPLPSMLTPLETSAKLEHSVVPPGLDDFLSRYPRLKRLCQNSKIGKLRRSNHPAPPEKAQQRLILCKEFYMLWSNLRSVRVLTHSLKPWAIAFRPYRDSEASVFFLPQSVLQKFSLAFELLGESRNIIFGFKKKPKGEEETAGAEKGKEEKATEEKPKEGNAKDAKKAAPAPAPAAAESAKPTKPAKTEAAATEPAKPVKTEAAPASKPKKGAKADEPAPELSRKPGETRSISGRPEDLPKAPPTVEKTETAVADTKAKKAEEPKADEAQPGKANNFNPKNWFRKKNAEPDEKTAAVEPEPAKPAPTKPAPRPENKPSPPKVAAEPAPKAHSPKPGSIALEDFALLAKRDDRSEILTRCLNQLSALKVRAHPLYKPLIADYVTLVENLRQEKTKGASKKLEDLRQLRGAIHERALAVETHLDWYEANHTGTMSHAFDDFLHLDDELEKDRLPRNDDLSKYLDSVESEFK